MWLPGKEKPMNTLLEFLTFLFFQLLQSLFGIDLTAVL